jgi:hypothetical protein
MLENDDSINISLNDIVSNRSRVSNYSNRNNLNNMNYINNASKINNINNFNMMNSMTSQNSLYRNNMNNYNQFPVPGNTKIQESQISNRISRPSNYQGVNPSSPIVTNSPIQLIDFSRGFQINPQALQFLRSIKEEIIIVSVVGKARTGKSYLMNLLLDLIGKGIPGFQVASSLQSCTKGIWLWGTPKNSLNGSAKIVFLDSEGTSSTDKSTRTYDSRIFALVVLISSLFLYNTYSNIDENGINELSLAAHLSDAITTNSNINKDDLLTELSPKFIWIIRDFTLEKVHPETGEEITSKEYLELCLKNKRSGKNSNDNNVIRQNIIKFFPERDCVTLIRPVDSEADLKRLNSIPYNNLKPEFKMEFKKLKDKIFKEALPKKLNGKKLTGPALATLIEVFVKVINSGKIPNINNTWDSVIEKDVSDSFYKSYDLFKMNLNELKLGPTNPYNNSDLLKKLYTYKYNSLNNYDNLLQTNGDTFKQKNYRRLYLETKKNLNSKLDSTIQKVLAQNNSLSANFCSNTLTTISNPLEGKLAQNAFNSKNYINISGEMTEALRKYNTAGKGPYKDEIAFDFLKNREKGFVKSLKEMAVIEGQKNFQKLDNNIKVAQADLNDMNNMKRVVDEKERIHMNKMKGLENDNKQLDEEVVELKQLLAAKKSTLNNLKRRNEQSRNNRKKLMEAQKREEANFDKVSNRSGLNALNETDDLNIKNNKNSKKNIHYKENQTSYMKKKKEKEEPGCKCLIF